VERIAGLGATEVTLAAAYHAVRAVTPFHPRHRIVTVPQAAVYYRPDPARWRGSRLRPASAAPAGSFGRAAERLRAAGLRVNAWAVLAHNARLGAAVPSCAVRNAYGDRYPWALCIASPEVRDYAATLAAEIAALEEADGIELEACGWYGFDHLSAHDKTGSGLAGAAAWPLSLCFCAACEQGYGEAGLDAGELRRAVRSVLDAASAGGPGAASAGGGQAGSLPEDLDKAVLAARTALAERFLRAVIAVVRSAAPDTPVLVHSHPDPRQAGANPGYDPVTLLGPGGADGIVLQCQGTAAESAALVARTAAELPGSAAPPRIAASLLAVAGLGGRTGELAGQADAVRAAGATELRLYHAGLASAADLAAMRSLIRGR